MQHCPCWSDNACHWTWSREDLREWEQPYKYNCQPCHSLHLFSIHNSLLWPVTVWSHGTVLLLVYCHVRCVVCNNIHINTQFIRHFISDFFPNRDRKLEIKLFYHLVVTSMFTILTHFSKHYLWRSGHRCNTKLVVVVFPTLLAVQCYYY